MLFIFILFAAATVLAAPAMDFLKFTNRRPMFSIIWAKEAKIAATHARAADMSSEKATRDIKRSAALDNPIHRASNIKSPNPPGSTDIPEWLVEDLCRHIDRMCQRSSRINDTAANYGGGDGPRRGEVAPSSALTVSFPSQNPSLGVDDHGSSNLSTGGDAGGGNFNFNVICKGISSCNPVIVVKGWNCNEGEKEKKFKLDKFGKVGATWRLKKKKKLQQKQQQEKQQQK